jgi:hypothetical protein
MTPEQVEAALRRMTPPEPEDRALAAFLVAVKKRRPESASGLWGSRGIRVSKAGLVAAAALVAALPALLFLGHGRNPESKAPAARFSGDEAIERLLGEARSSSPQRREFAILALKAYGEAALDPIMKANLDPALFGNYRLKPEDPAVRTTLQRTLVSLDAENTPLGDILKTLSREAGVKITLDPSFEKKVQLETPITFKIKDLSARNALKLLTSQFTDDLHCEEGAVVLFDPASTSVPSPALAPIRIGRNKAAGVRLLKELREDSVERREAARAGLYRMGFAVEEALWEALDARDVEIQGSASDLLRWLYSPSLSAQPLVRPGSGGARRKAYEARVTMSVQGSPLVTTIDFLRNVGGLNFHLSGVKDPDQVLLDFDGSDVPIHAALLLALEPEKLTVTYRDGVILVSDGPPQAPLESWTKGTFWTDPGEARTIEKGLLALSAPTAQERDRGAAELLALGARVLEILRSASQILDGEAAARCRTLRDQILKRTDPEEIDEPHALELRPGTPGQELLQEIRDLKADHESLEPLLKKYGVRYELRAKADRTYTFAVKNVALGTLLRALLYPQGLDFTIREGQVVIDTCQHLRETLKR